jgi:ribosomal protein L29
MADERARSQTGRAWRAEELRLKGHDDLHKLWFVLLQEKNKLKSDQLMSIQLKQRFYGMENFYKVRKSMARLLTVVNERKKLRSEYRRVLEDEYIQAKKAEEATQLEEELAVRRANGERTGMTPGEVSLMLQERKERKENKFNLIKDSMMSTFEKSARTNRDGEEFKVATAPLLDEGDIAYLAQSRMKLSQKDILKSHVKNWAELDLKQRRKVMSHIQAQRASHAKQIFLKELGAVGSQHKLNKGL